MKRVEIYFDGSMDPEVIAKQLTKVLNSTEVAEAISGGAQVVVDTYRDKPTQLLDGSFIPGANPEDIGHRETLVIINYDQED